MIIRRVLAPLLFLALLGGVADAQSIYDPYLFVTFAGLAGAAGNTDGTGAAARFSSPTAITVDPFRNLFVCDTGNNTIRKITPAGAVSTLAGSPGLNGSLDGPGSTARFASPQGIARDSAGNLFVADTDNHTIRKIDTNGAVSTFAGAAGAAGSTDGTGALARFNSPAGLAIDSANNLYVGDSFNHTIRKITPGAAVTTLAGVASSPGSTDGLGGAARFNFPRGLVVNNANEIYVADTFNFVIRKITPAGQVTTLAGMAGMGGSADGTGSAARFFNPRALAVDANSNILAVDTNNSTIRKITPAALVRTAAGIPGTDGSTNGVGSAALFRSPQGVAIDSAGNVYIGDTGNNTIRVGGPATAFSTVAISLFNAHAFLTGHAPPNAAVGILATADMTSMFVSIATVNADSNGFYQYEDMATATFARRFYRSLIPPAP